MRELIRKQHKSWTPKEEEALAAGVQKHGAGNRKTILKYSKFARYLAQKSSTDLWKKWDTLTFRVSDKLKPLSPKAKKIVAANLVMEGINEKKSMAFDDQDQEEKDERILEMEEDKEESIMSTMVKNDADDVQNSANAEEEKVTSMMDAAEPSEAVRERERIMKMKEFEDAKSMLLFANEILDRFLTQDTNQVSATIDTAFSQAVNKESKSASEMAEDIDRFSAVSPAQAEKETEVDSRDGGRYQSYANFHE